ncbi:hypothetical protein EXIGLDRAFT_47112 [Exidia glandulosa HHB12029]|uniref:Uncharacterized protein n=1 Tax=Exidia glandulosa HHB12029 TaxID=1314781 RepID=A0A165P5E6_EXIGL|nr:hypothetical protein EXIGLDRAFT_47112 [Exidia glandulosa HHB12029]
MKGALLTTFLLRSARRASELPPSRQCGARRLLVVFAAQRARPSAPRRHSRRPRRTRKSFNQRIEDLHDYVNPSNGGTCNPRHT